MQKKLLNRYVVEAVTDVGLVHLNNEDNILIEEDLALLLVADGMGRSEEHTSELQSR